MRRWPPSRACTSSTAPRIRRRFEQRFTARRMAEDYVDVYEELIGARQPQLHALTA